MKKKIALATLAMIPMSVTNSHASNQTGIVTAPSLNVRSGPSTKYNVLFTVKKDEVVNIIETSNGWYKIKTSSGKEGWSSSSYITKTNSESDTTTGSTKKVGVSRLNMRSGPSTSYRVITVLTEGQEVEVISESNGWAKIKHDGRLGYVSSQYLEGTSNDTQVKETKVVNTASLNVRSGPGTNYNIVGKVTKGTKVGVISESNGWSKISYNGKVSYVSSMYLDKVSNPTPEPEPTPPPVEEVKETKVVNTASLNVRSGPGTNYNIIGKVTKGTKVGVISESNGWSKISYNGKTAYVASSYLDKVSNPTPEPTPPPVEEVKETKVVNTASLNVRSGPGTNYNIIGKVTQGTKVGVISESNGWSKISYNGKTAYVASSYLDKVSNPTPDPEPTPPPVEEVKETKIVNTASLNVRSGPGTNYDIIGKVTQGTKVGVISESNGWSKISYNGKTAYVASSYLSVEDSGNPNPTPPPTDEDSSEIINGATVNYIAVPYTLQDHINVQMERVSLGGNVIDSSKPRSSEVLTTFGLRQATRGFVPADINDITYFVNPANFTNSSKGMMQFLRIDSYKGGVTADELNSYLNSLSPASSGTNVFYNQGQAFINAAQKYNIDLVYLVSHAMWETGYGKSTLAQGQTLTSFKGEPLPQPVTVYNFFGIGAIDHSANLSGAEAAYSNGWTSIEATIDGSAKWIANNYVKSSKYQQNTIYKMKFNYDYSWHQYATDVNWANGISGIMNKLITMYDTGNNLVFDVPKYK